RPPRPRPPDPDDRRWPWPPNPFSKAPRGVAPLPGSFYVPSPLRSKSRDSRESGLDVQGGRHVEGTFARQVGQDAEDVAKVAARGPLLGAISERHDVDGLGLAV